MNTPKWAALTEKLANNPEPKVRRKACQRLAATRDPAVIPSLRRAYFEDQDDRVRDAAREALARFKAMEAGQPTRQVVPSERILAILLGGLSVVFVITLVVNIAGMIGSDDAESGEPNDIFNPTDRMVLVDQISERLDAAQTLVGHLRTAIDTYNTSGQLVCDVANQLPPALGFSEMDKKTYPDLGITADKFDAALNPLNTVLVLLSQACVDPSKQTTNVLNAVPKLDQAEAQIDEVAMLLQTAITNPAATVGPTVTPLPTWTPTPTLTHTPAPPTATVPATETPLASDTPPPTPTSEHSPTPSNTPTPVATLPFPALDYPQILSALSERLVVIGDIKNSYGSGMLDQWQKVQDGEAASTTICDNLQDWPTVFSLTPEQQALLDAPSAADSTLEEAIRLQIEGINLAVQARALYERDCPGGSLSISLEQGIALSEEALSKLQEFQRLVEDIRNRTEN
jgi:hypothetical protein